MVSSGSAGFCLSRIGSIWGRHLYHPTARQTNSICQNFQTLVPKFYLGTQLSWKQCVAPTDKASSMALLLLPEVAMHATFTQKVIICMVAGFLAACLIQWGKVFVLSLI